MSSINLTASQISTRRIINLVFATITLLILGLIYAWSIFATPIGKSYPEYGTMLPIVFQISMFAFCFSALGGAQIIKKTSAKVAIIFAALLMGIGFVLTAYGTGLGIWALIIFYGVLAGSGCGIGYNAIISLVNPWFPDKIGLCSGIQMMGFGISSLVFGSLASTMIDMLGGDWPTVFVIIAIVAFLVMFALAIVVKPAPANIAEVLGLPGSSAAVTSKTQQQFILTTKVFWLYAVWAIFIIACGLTLIGTARQGAELLGLNGIFFEGFAGILVGLVSTMNGVGRIINGAVFDKAGLIPVMLLSSVLAIFCMTGLALSLSLNIGFLYVICAILVAMPYGSVPVMASAYARQRYGAKGFAMNLGIANCTIGAAAFINIVITAILGTTYGGNGPIIYAILAVMAVVALLFTFMFSKVYKSDLAKIKAELDSDIAGKE
jgi:OFA family oxalate/formate antiporter-like MFS transporter